MKERGERERSESERERDDREERTTNGTGYV